MKSTIILFILLSFFSCRQAETKRVIEKFNNGQEGIVLYYVNKNDTLSYRKEAFYNDGENYYKGHIKNGKKDGIWIWWYGNGNKKDQCKYSNGFYVDTVFHWYDNGQLRQIEIVNGKKIGENDCCNCNGKIIRYYNNGKIKEQFTITDNLEQDTSKMWYNNGQLEHYAYFKNDKEEGPSEWYYFNGSKKSKGQYLNGQLDGEIYHWDSLGKATLITVYKNGKIIEEK